MSPALFLSPQRQPVQGCLGRAGEEWHPADDPLLRAWRPLSAVSVCKSTRLPDPREREGGRCMLPSLGFPGGASGEEPTCQHRTHKRCQFDPWVGKIPWRRARQPIPVLLFRENHGQRSLANYSPEGHKDLDTTEASQNAHRHTWAHPLLQVTRCYIPWDP